MDNLTDKIYQLSLDTSWLNDQFGDVESAYGWNGLIIGKMFIFVISVDNQGFKYLRTEKINKDNMKEQPIIDDWYNVRDEYYFIYGDDTP